MKNLDLKLNKIQSYELILYGFFALLFANLTSDFITRLFFETFQYDKSEASLSVNILLAVLTVVLFLIFLLPKAIEKASFL